MYIHPVKKTFCPAFFPPPRKTAKTHFYSRTIAAVFVARRTCGSIYRGIFFPLLTAAGFIWLSGEKNIIKKVLISISKLKYIISLWNLRLNSILYTAVVSNALKGRKSNNQPTLTVAEIGFTMRSNNEITSLGAKLLD